jgi:predicted dehydrogenase
MDLLDEGRLGELTFCRIRLSHDGAVAGWLPERFYDPTAAVGGALSDLGCHPVYLTQLFLGMVPTTVSATYRSFTKRQVEDQAVVTLGYNSGAIGVVETGFLSRDPFTIEASTTTFTRRTWVGGRVPPPVAAASSWTPATTRPISCCTSRVVRRPRPLPCCLGTG